MPDNAPYDAVVVVSFGGPERPDDVMPFLENVVRGRGVPRERLLAVAEHYHHLGGKSPINDHCRALIAALEVELSAHGIDLPVYWGNRNWHPLLPDTLREMQAAGVKRALAYVTSAFSSYSGCRQYLQNIEAARAEVGQGAPVVEKLRGFYNHPAFIDLWADSVRAALAEVASKLSATAARPARVLFTAHSIPVAMAQTCAYERELLEACALVMARVGQEPHALVYQSRSGPPQVPWLEPDILAAIRSHAEQGGGPLVIAPIGFVSDHVEVVWDLDHEAVVLAEQLGVPAARARTPNDAPAFVAMVRELIEERLGRRSERRFLGSAGARPDACAVDCCAYSPRRP